MIRFFVLLLISVSLTSFAPVPVPPSVAVVARPHIQTIVVPRARAVERARLAVDTIAPPAQACTFETAPAKLSAQIADPIGYPFGNVQAWSCSGDGLAVANELAERAGAMRAEAAAYRQAHPIAGVR